MNLSIERQAWESGSLSTEEVACLVAIAMEFHGLEPVTAKTDEELESLLSQLESGAEPVDMSSTQASTGVMIQVQTVPGVEIQTQNPNWCIDGQLYFELPNGLWQYDKTFTLSKYPNIERLLLYKNFKYCIQVSDERVASFFDNISAQAVEGIRLCLSKL